MKRILNVVEYNKASSWFRLANYFLDFIMLYVINYLLSILAYFLYEVTSVEFFYYYSNGNIV